MLTLEAVHLEQGTFSLRADFCIATNAHVSIIGPSGAGKSSLLAAIAGFLAPKSGRILWRGDDITELAPGMRPMAILFQDNNLFPHLTVAQNVVLGLRPTSRPTPKEALEVQRALQQVGLAGMEASKPGALSGGQQSRVALARVLLQERPMMLLDEPFAALGPALKSEMLQLVQDLARSRGITVLMVTHDPRDALQMGGQTVFIDTGCAAAPLPTEALFSDPPEALRRYLAI